LIIGGLTWTNIILCGILEGQLQRRLRVKIAHKFAVAGGVAALIAGAGMGGLALADIPDSTTSEITGCYTTGGGGQVRVIDKEDSASCHSYETEFSWPSESAPKVVTVSVSRTGDVDENIACPSGFIPTAGGASVADNSYVWEDNRPYNSGTPTPNIPTHWQFNSDGIGGAVGVTLYVTCVG
jgi:hypothetical protein